MTWETVAQKQAYILFWERIEGGGVEEYEQFQDDDQIEDWVVGEKSKTAEQGSTQLEQDMDTERGGGILKVAIGKKRSLETCKDERKHCLRSKEEVKVKRHKNNGRELTQKKPESLETTESTSKWNKKPKGRQKQEVYNAGDTPGRRESQEKCLKDQNMRPSGETSGQGQMEVELESKGPQDCEKLGSM